jgi:hypothetical protein
LILGIFLLVACVLSFALAVIADLLRTNRILQEETLERLKEIQYGISTDSENLPRSGRR